jgi:serine/threonine-protein kinase
MDRENFFRHLRRSGLLSEAELEQAARLSGSLRAGAIARALVDGGLLTRYQAKRVLAGKPARLLLGQYRILHPLGRGAMGRVFKAVHTTMARVVAIKVILPGILKDQSVVELFNREVRAAARLSHPNIAAAYDANEVKGLRFLVMEYVPGPSLQDLVKARGPLAIDLACEVMRQAAVALQYAHEKGMVHRDIKPGNLLICEAPGLPGAGPRPLVKVVDFGLARLCGTATSDGVDTIRVEPGAVFGTVDYISPEQAHNVHAVDIRSDLYSLGCVFYYALTGQVPFPGGTSMEKLFKQLMSAPQPLRELRPEVPAALEAVVRRLMAKEKDQRFQTPAELAAELAALSGRRERPEPQPPAAAELPDVLPADEPAADTAESAGLEPVGDLQETSCLLPAAPVVVPPLDPAFREKFRQWTAIIEFSSRRRGSLRRLNREAFAVLHRDLVATCQAQAGVGRDRRRAFFERLEGLLRPWMSPEALAHADLEIHAQLARMFQQAERELDKWLVSDDPADSDQTNLGRLLARFKRRGAPYDWKAQLRKVFGLGF